MVLSKLALANFRNYNSAQLSFSDHLNLIYGHNAQGKTNLLEAIYLLCLGRSFRMVQNQEMLKHECDYFTVEGNLVLDNEISKPTVLRYVRDRKKEISVDRKKLRSHSELIGQFPIVIMAPDEFKITTGGPSERRRFIDILLSQVSLSYLKNLQEYYRILKQRNQILQDMKAGVDVSESTLTPWTQNLAGSAAEIVRTRFRFVREFAPILRSIYKKYTESEDALEMAIESVIDPADDDFRKQFTAEIEKSKRKERALGTTVVGPHREDIIFTINGKDLRKYGSRGEHKSVLLSIKIAEFKFLKEKKEETPLLLLDDCYSELDKYREEKVFQSLQGLGQIFLTTPKKHEVFENMSFETSDVATFTVENGEVTKA